MELDYRPTHSHQADVLLTLTVSGLVRSMAEVYYVPNEAPFFTELLRGCYCSAEFVPPGCVAVF